MAASQYVMMDSVHETGLFDGHSCDDAACKPAVVASDADRCIFLVLLLGLMLLAFVQDRVGMLLMRRARSQRHHLVLRRLLSATWMLYSLGLNFLQYFGIHLGSVNISPVTPTRLLSPESGIRIPVPESFASWLSSVCSGSGEHLWEPLIVPLFLFVSIIITIIVVRFTDDTPDNDDWCSKEELVGEARDEEELRGLLSTLDGKSELAAWVV